MQVASVAKAEVAGVLAEEGWKDGVAPEVAIEVIAKVGSIPTAEAFEALVVAGVRVFSLTDASIEAGEDELVGVEGALEEEMKLLASGNGRGVAVVDGVEVRNNSGDALGLFQLEFRGSPRVTLPLGFRSLGGGGGIVV